MKINHLLSETAQLVLGKAKLAIMYASRIDASAASNTVNQKNLTHCINLMVLHCRAMIRIVLP